MTGAGVAVVILSTLAIVAGVVILWMAMQSQRHLREMEHRERLAMIERGLVPSPELDPVAFERAIGISRRPESPAVVRARSAGIMAMALGFGFALLLTFTAHQPGAGIGIGGAIVALGAASCINAMLMGRHESGGPRADAPYPLPRPLPKDPAAPPSH